MREPVKIIYLITELDTGGAQAALYRLLGRLGPGQYQPIVVCFYNGHGTHGHLITKLGYPVIDLSTHGKKWRLDALWRLMRLLHKEKPEILHTWLFHANIAGRVIGRLVGVPIIISSERDVHLSNRFRDWINRATAPLATRIVCVSKAVADYLAQEIRVDKNKLEIIPNGIPLADYVVKTLPALIKHKFGIPLDSLVIGSVGRLNAVKNFDLLIRVFTRLLKPHPNACLVLAGDGPERDALMALCQELGLIFNQQVFFLGYQSDIPSILSAFDIFVLPSEVEGMPNAVLEAMVMGLPVISTASGGTQEIIQNQAIGVLVPPGDANALYHAVDELASNPELREKLGKSAQLHAIANYSIERTVELTTRLYQALLVKVLQETP